MASPLASRISRLAAASVPRRGKSTTVSAKTHQPAFMPTSAQGVFESYEDNLRLTITGCSPLLSSYPPLSLCSSWQNRTPKISLADFLTRLRRKPRRPAFAAHAALAEQAKAVG